MNGKEVLKMPFTEKILVIAILLVLNIFNELILRKK